MEQQQHSNPDIANGLEKIKRIVVVMFENRSFNHLFGDFSGVNGLFDKDGNFKKDCYNLQKILLAHLPKVTQNISGTGNKSAGLDGLKTLFFHCLRSCLKLYCAVICRRVLGFS